MKSSVSVSEISEDMLQTISENRLIINYMDNGQLPSIDELLDRRLLITELFEEKLLSENWLNAEIIAIDFLLSKCK